MPEAPRPEAESSREPFPALTARQRRVLAVLVEKAFTTPEYYPLTLKALTAGCNQKSNRQPVVQFDEADVEETMDELRQLGLAAVVHPESGRTERYRHYMRHRLTLSEPQLAILTELLLRGRQQLGELRSRASRMVPVESLEQLRDELQGLLEMKLVQLSGPLQRRGVEVDHNLYAEGESSDRPITPATKAPLPQSADGTTTASAGEGTAASVSLAALENGLRALREENRELKQQLAALEETVARLQQDFNALQRDLGG